jgi:hypothetical protein
MALIKPIHVTCPNCKTAVFHNMTTCPKCGGAIEWPKAEPEKPAPKDGQTKYDVT